MEWYITLLLVFGAGGALGLIYTLASSLLSVGKSSKSAVAEIKKALEDKKVTKKEMEDILAKVKILVADLERAGEDVHRLIKYFVNKG